MGSLSTVGPTLPFMTGAHYQQACSIIERVIARLADQGRHFSGVMNSGFFATAEGVKVIEFNARFGDPECINIISLFEGSWPAVMERIASATLTAADVPLRREASLVLYLVSPDYALRPGPAYRVHTRPRRARSAGLPRVLLLGRGAGREHVRDRRHVPGPRPRDDRANARAGTPPDRRCAESVGVLEWRRDIGKESYLEELAALVGQGDPAGGQPLLGRAI